MSPASLPLPFPSLSLVLFFHVRCVPSSPSPSLCPSTRYTHVRQVIIMCVASVFGLITLFTTISMLITDLMNPKDDQGVKSA